VLPPNSSAEGAALLHDRTGGTCDLLAVTGKELQKVRGRRIGLVFQSALGSFSPMETLGDISPRRSSFTFDPERLRLRKPRRRAWRGAASPGKVPLSFHTSSAGAWHNGPPSP
jgi:hypothetical protein